MSKVSVIDEKDYDTEAMKTTIKRIKSLDISEDYKKEIIESINEKGLHLFIHESGFDFRLFYILTFACILGIERCGFLLMVNHEILQCLGYMVLTVKKIMEYFSETIIYIYF